MSVDPHTAKHRREHGGRTYYFCSARCAEKFEAEPETYLGPERAQAKPAPKDAIYTCPMHPEIEQVGPGDCPICGMALEPKTVPLEEEVRAPNISTCAGVSGSAPRCRCRC